MLTALIDVNQARIAVAVHQAAAFRFWLIGHHLSREAGGPGWCGLESLWDSISDLPGLHCTRRHFRRILAHGDGLFWSLTDDRAYLTSSPKLAAELVVYAGLRGLESVIASNLPGSSNRVEIELFDSLERFESTIYRAWLVAARRDTLARETLAGLWNRGPDTLRRWESRHLKARVKVTANYAVCTDTSQINADDAHYDRRIGGVVYQIPNTYTARGFQSSRKGQKRKIRRAVGGVELGVDAEHQRLYFDSAKALRRAIRRHSCSHERFLFWSARTGAHYWKRASDIFASL